MAIKLNSMKNMLYEAAWKADNGTIDLWRCSDVQILLRQCGI